MPGVTEDRPFAVLFVCTANKIRSPMAELLFRRALEDRWGPVAGEFIQVGSAGFQVAHPGTGMDPLALDVLAERGVDGGEFARRRIERTHIEYADLILTATRQHRSQVVQMDPRALSRIFTLKQFGYLLAGSDPSGDADFVADGPELIERAAAARAQVPARTDEDDLGDPVNGPVAGFRSCVGTIADSIAPMLRLLPPTVS